MVLRDFRCLEKNAAKNFRCPRKKNRPKDKYYFFEIEYSKTSLTATLTSRPIYKLALTFYSLLLSQLPFFSSFESLFQQTNIRDSAGIRAQGFFSCPECSKMAAKGPASPTRFLSTKPQGSHRVISFLFFTFPLLFLTFWFSLRHLLRFQFLFFTSPFFTQIPIVFTRKYNSLISGTILEMLASDDPTIQCVFMRYEMGLGKFMQTQCRNKKIDPDWLSFLSRFIRKVFPIKSNLFCLFLSI